MYHFARVRVTGFFFLLATAGSALSQETENGRSAPPTSVTVLEEIVVTARRREEGLQDSPVAVTALSQRYLAQTGARTFEDFAVSVPGLSFVGNNSPENKIVLRGVSTGVITRDEGSVIGLYIDDVPVGSRRFNPDLRLYDIERIEVLRGPQGTLFGEGSIGGTLRLVPNKPDLQDFSGVLEASGSKTHSGAGDGNYELAATLNTPIIEDRFGIRLVGYYVDESGFVDNVILNRKDVNQSTTEGQRLIARFKKDERTLITASIIHQETEISGKAQYDPGLGDLLQARNFEEALGDDFTLANLTLSLKFDAVTLDSSSAFFDRSVINFRDISPLLPGGALAFLDDLTEFESVVQEFRLTSNRGLFNDRLDWLLGAYYRDDEEFFRQDSQSVALGGDILDSDNFLDRKQIAVFGEIDWRLTGKLTASAGLRWFDIDQDGRNVNAGLLNSLAPGVITVTNTNSSEDGINPKFRLSYTATDDVLLYTVASRGFREGGPTGQGVPVDPVTGVAAPTQFDSDSLWNYEFGFKTGWLENRVVLNGAVFYIDWQDIQTTSLRSDGHTFSVNAGDARSKGAEIELRAVPVAGLELFVTASYVNSELTEDQLLPGDGQSGDRIPGVPEVSFSAGLHYVRPVSGNIDGFFNLNYQHVGDSFNGFGFATGTSNSISADRQDAYNLTNIRLGLQNGVLEAALFAENIGDERAVLFFNRFIGGEVRINTVRPRTVGFGLKVRF